MSPASSASPGSSSSRSALQSSPPPGITVSGARTRNLRDIDVHFPAHAVTVVTGVSGSGKTSLVIDTVAAEAQRATAADFPSFVRTRMARFPPADVDRIDGLTFTSVVDQRRLTGNARSTVATAVDLAVPLRMLFSRFASPSAGFSPAYSRNDPSGMCPRCEGLATVTVIDEDALVDPSRSLDAGAVQFPTFAPGTYRWRRLVTSGLCDPGVPWGELPSHTRDLLLHARDLQLESPLPGYPAHGRFDGVVPRIRDSYLRRTPTRLSAAERAGLDAVVSRTTCPECSGAGLNAAARASLLCGDSIAQWCAIPVDRLHGLLDRADEELGEAAAPLTAEISRRVDALLTVGLGYLTLDRPTPTLSGGEARRIRTVRHLGSPLTEVTYIFDEPSAGLHPHDVRRLTGLLGELRDRGNTVLVIDHSPDVIAAADHVVVTGPGAGSSGGRVTYCGPAASMPSPDPAVVRSRVRTPSGALPLAHARSNNLRDVSVTVPEGVLTVVTGVAGSGKSSLFTVDFPAAFPDFTVVGQEPLRGGRRSDLLTVTGVADAVRSLFAATSGGPAAWFSRNSQGACPDCHGSGEVRTDLAFMDDLRVRCEACGGTGFNDRALATTVEGLTVADVGGMSAAAVADLLGEKDAARLRWVCRVGLGYLAVGRTVDGLSGGERQRLLLARHLAEAVVDGGSGGSSGSGGGGGSGATKPVKIILDEPMTGLNASDVDLLLTVFDDLVEAGGTVIVIEHSLRAVARADHVIDIGPGAGTEGGRVVFEGTPADLSISGTLTGLCLSEYLNGMGG